MVREGFPEGVRALVRRRWKRLISGDKNLAHSESCKNAGVMDKEREEATEDGRGQIAPGLIGQVGSFTVFPLRAKSLKAWKSRSGTI